MCAKKKPAKNRDWHRGLARNGLEKVARKSDGHYNAILLEDISSKMDQVIEGMESTKQELRAEIGEFREHADHRFAVLEAAVTAHTKQIHDLTSEVKTHGKILAEHGAKLDAHGAKLDRFEKNQRQMEERLSAKLDTIALRLDNHEGRIVALETALP